MGEGHKSGNAMGGRKCGKGWKFSEESASDGSDAVLRKFGRPREV